jgi:hypothetical protein
VACELAFIVWNHIEEHLEWSKARSSGAIPFPAKPKRLKLILELMSVALVVFGIIGELRVDAKLGDLDTNVQDTNEDRATHLQQEADSAETAAGKAQWSANEAQGAANKADQDAGNAKTRADGAHADANAALTDAKQLRIELKQARDETAAAQFRQAELSRALEIEDDFRLRVPNLSLRIPGIDILRRLEPMAPITALVEYKNGDPEAQAYARIIVHTLAGIGWTVNNEPSGPRPVDIPSVEDPRNGMPAIGVRIFNNKIPFGHVTGIPQIFQNGVVAVDPFMLIWHLRNPGISDVDLSRLVYLALALDADAKKTLSFPTTEFVSS